MYQICAATSQSVAPHTVSDVCVCVSVYHSYGGHTSCKVLCLSRAETRIESVSIDAFFAGRITCARMYRPIPSGAPEEDVLNRRVAINCTVGVAIVFAATSCVIFSSGNVHVTLLSFPFISLFMTTVAVSVGSKLLSFECMPPIWRAFLGTSIASQFAAFYCAQPEELKKFPELWLQGRMGARLISFLVGIIIVSMPRTMRWKLVTASMASLASCFLVGYMLLLIGVTWPNIHFTLIYFLEHTGAMWIGVGSMHTVGSYLTATFSKLRGKLAESELRIGELEQARRDALEMDFFRAYQLAYKHEAASDMGPSEGGVGSVAESQSESDLSSATHYTTKQSACAHVVFVS